MTPDSLLARAPGFANRRISQPLWLAMLLSLALYLTFVYFYQPGDVTVFPHRFLANGFCQLIIATFLATALYTLFQYLSLVVEDYHLGRRLAARAAPPFYPLLCFCAGRENYTRDPWIGLLGKALGESHPGLAAHLHEVYTQLSQQRLAPIQFSIWVMPMLGFIGTVVGIIQAIGGLEAALDRSGGDAGLATVLAGLSFAFDTTLLGLVLVIPLMVGMLPLRHRLQHHELHYRGLLLALPRAATE